MTPAAILAGVSRLGLSATGLEWIPPESAAEGIGEQFRESGIQFSEIECYSNLECEPGPTRDAIVERLRQTLRLAGVAGSRCVVSGVGQMDPDRPDEVAGAHPDNWTDRAMDRLVETCVEVAELAGGAGTKFCVEPWVLTTLNTPRRLGELVRRVASPHFGILLDPVNLMSLDVYFDNTRVIQESFAEAGDAISLVHAKDTKLVVQDTYHMTEACPGEGILDYATLLRCMDDLQDPTTPLLIEHLRDYGKITEARDYIRETAAAAAVAV